MQIFSLLHDHEDIITQCLHQIQSEHLTDLKKTDIQDKCLQKIIATIYYFKNNNMMPDGIYCKVLENNIIEFRLQLPKSNHLLRIIWAYNQEKIVLLTWYLIKPEQYSDRNTTINTDKLYTTHIINAHSYRKDFITHQKYNYTNLTDILFPNH